MSAILDSAPQGFSVWGLDFRLVVCNRAYLTTYGFSASDVKPGTPLGAVAKLSVGMGNHPDFTAEQMLALYHERLEGARSSGQPVRVEKAIKGRVIASTHTFLPDFGWLVMHEDVTEQTEQKWMTALTEKSLDAQNRRFRAAIENMPHGLSMYDAEWRMVICNSRYLDLYGLSPEAARPGTPFTSIIEQRRQSGAIPLDMEEDDFHGHVLRTSDPTTRRVQVYRLRSGRVVQVSQSAIEGGGFVAIHQDITEDVARLDVLKASHHEIATQKARFEAALENMSHGLAIFDADMRLVVRNKRYLEIYGLPGEIVVPGIPLMDIAKLRIVAGTHPAHQPDFLDLVANAKIPAERFDETAELKNGRVIRVTRSPVDGGGFIAVHQDITEERQSLDALRASHEEIAVQKLRFEAALANISHGLSMYDAEGRLVISNDRYRQIYNAPQELVRPGMRYADLVAKRDGPRGFKLIPKSDEFVAVVLGEVSSETETIEAYRLGDGRTVSIRQSSMADGGFVRTHQDITRQVERFETLQRAERAAAKQNRVLKQQNERFDAAINNMSQGLCMFDKQERLVVCNQRYAKLYNLPPELVQPGTSLGQIMAFRFSHGMMPKAGKEAYLANRRRLVDEALEAKDEIELVDGRTIFIHHRPMKGGGWVATHEDVTEQRRIEARVRHLARHDALTDLPNRAFLREQMDKIGARIKRSERIGVLCIDLDHFKAVNDTLGHAVGDHVLIEVATRLKRCARENDLVVRLGGDEFAMIVQSLEDPQDAAGIAARIVKLMAETMEIEGHQINIGTSVGITLAPSDGGDVETLLKNADTALYRAKSEGRGNYHFFERGMDDALQHRRLLEQGLKVALAHNEFRLMYQPLLDLKTNRICCFEALLRWDHPEHGTISPVEFIPVAEETGLIFGIGEWVLREACKAASSWPSDVRIAVNLSPAQFKQRGLVEHVIAALADADLQPSRLELEVTESLLIADTESTLQILHRLRALGVRISMDDFGTGYSSLSYLRSFPFDKIKIDRTFVAGLKPGDESTAIIRAVVGLGHSLGMSTTAEGIETEAQLDAVREQGCNEVQGFLFSPPLPASGIAALLGGQQDDAPLRRKASSRRA